VLQQMRQAANSGGPHGSGMSKFDYPSIFSEATAVHGAALCKNGFDTPMAQFLLV
jgi:hypothetical protein